MEYLENDPIRLSADRTAVEVIDQRLLPGELRWVSLRSAGEVAEAIRTLAVRGAPLIGICAAYGICIAAAKALREDREHFFERFKTDSLVISGARPTAVDPYHAAQRLRRRLERQRSAGHGPEEITEGLFEEAVSLHEEEIRTCLAISELGLTLIKDGSTVITHCNAGAMATGRYGTGLGPLLLGAEKGYTFHAYVDETRPLLQGARITAFELMRAGVDTTLMCDDMAAYVMAQGKTDACMVGCDRVAVNGDTANKIGTCGLAVLAKHYGVPFYVFCPVSTIDLCCKTGADIQIEMRDGREITGLYFEKPVAPEGVRCLDPSFDVTPAELITAIVTERGIFYPPYDFSAFGKG